MGNSSAGGDTIAILGETQSRPVLLELARQGHPEAAMLQRQPSSDQYAMYEAGIRTNSTSLTNLATYLFGTSEYADRF